MLMEVWGAALIAFAMACQLRTPYDTTAAKHSRERTIYWVAAVLPAATGMIVAWIANIARVNGAFSSDWMRLLYPGLMGAAAGIGAAAALASARLLPTLIASAIASAACALVIVMTREGWLRWLGIDASLGHGAIDLTNMAIMALSISGVLIVRSTTDSAQIRLAPTWIGESAVRAIATVSLTGAGFALINLQIAQIDRDFLSAQLLGAILTGTAALGAGLLYGWFVTGWVDLRFGTQSLLAALIGASSIALVPPLLAPLIGVLCAFCALPGAQWIRERTGRRDPRGVIGALAAPALISLLATGLLADGGQLPGWNNVGIGAYLNTLGLGVVGWFVAGDVGQFSAQIVLTTTALGIAAASAAVAFQLGERIAPQWMVEHSTSTELDTFAPRTRPTPDADAEQQAVDGETLDKPRKTLPQTRAYRVAYPFRDRAAKKRSQRFVVQDDDAGPNRS
jgi:hypothetical protein